MILIIAKNFHLVKFMTRKKINLFFNLLARIVFRKINIFLNQIIFNNSFFKNKGHNKPFLSKLYHRTQIKKKH